MNSASQTWERMKCLYSDRQLSRSFTMRNFCWWSIRWQPVTYLSDTMKHLGHVIAKLYQLSQVVQKWKHLVELLYGCLCYCRSEPNAAASTLHTHKITSNSQGFCRLSCAFFYIELRLKCYLNTHIPVEYCTRRNMELWRKQCSSSLRSEWYNVVIWRWL